MTHALLSPEKVRTGLGERFNAWQLVTVCAWLVMSLAWVNPAWSLISGNPGTPLVWLTFGGVSFATFGAAAGMANLKLKRQAAQTVLFIILISSLVFALRWNVFAGAGLSVLDMPGQVVRSFTREGPLVGVLATAAAVLYLWRKGDQAWQGWIGPLIVRRAFVSGIIILIGLGSLASMLKTPVPAAEFFLFLFSSLLALGGSRLSAQAHVRGGRGVPLTKAWIFGVGGSALGLLTIAGVTAFIVGGPLATVLAGLFGRLARGVLSGILFILKPLAYLIVAAWNALLMRLGMGSERLAEAPQITLDDQIQEQLAVMAGEVQPPAWAGDLGRILTYAGGVLVAILILIIIAAALRRSSRLRQWRSTPEAEPVGGQSLMEALRSLLRPGDARRPGNGLLQPVRRWLAAARIRWIYSRMLRALARRNQARSAAETPLEYLRRLSDVYPRGAADLTLLTHVYQGVRYGELPETRGDIDQVEVAWDRIQQVIRTHSQPESEPQSP